MTKLNAKASIINRVISLVCNFASRTVFIKILGNEYLGLGGMFGNVFSVLSLCELGFGEAVSQSLYKPLARKEFGVIKSIIQYYSKIYRVISALTFTLSVAFMPFLPYVFPDIRKIEGYRAIYLLFVVHQMLSYYFAPKRSLVMCDQRMYAVMAIRTVTSVLLTAVQIFFLYSTQNYLIYIFFRIFFLSADGLVVNMYANRSFPYINDKNFAACEIHKDYKKGVWSNTKALIYHRIGGVINSSADSILISSCLGFSQMGVYSNYSLIIHSVGGFVSLAVNAASASVGNLGATEKAKKSEQVLGKICFANFVMMTNCTALFVNLINPFISWWIGPEKCFGTVETAVIIACFYMSYIRDPVQIFIHSYAVFKSTGPLYIARGILNLVLSLFFVKRYGAAGVFAGTLISTVVTAFFFEPVLLFKGAFGTKPGNFMKAYLSYPVVSTAICLLTLTVTSHMFTYTLLDMIIRAAAVLVLTNISLAIMYGKTDEFRTLISFVPFFRKIKRLNMNKSEHLSNLNG